MLKFFFENSKSIAKSWTSTRTLCSLQRNFSVDGKNEVSTQATLNSNPPTNQVIIVGAGLSGLSAADHLIRNGIRDVLILEAAERYGGRIHTIKFGDAICELGAKWINAKDTPHSMFRLAKQGGLIERNSFESNLENFFIINNEALDDELVHLASIMFNDIIKSTQKYMLNDVPPDQRTADMYIKAKMNKILARMSKADARVTKSIFQVLLRNLNCQLGSDLGYVHVKHLANIATHLDNPIFIPSGLDQIFKQLVQNIPIDRLMLSKPVKKIRWTNFDSNEGPHVICMDGSKYYANHIISTIPLGALNAFSNFLFNPNLPTSKIEAMKKLGRGSPAKIYLHYDEPVNTWFIGSIMLDSTQLDFPSHENWTNGISEITTSSGSRKVIEIMVGGVHSEIVERLPEDILDREVTFALRKIMKNNKIQHPKENARSLWSTDAKTLGGLPFISRESTESSIADLATPLGLKDGSTKPTLLFAGDATSFDGFGTMEAARQSGIREAKRILGVT